MIMSVVLLLVLIGVAVLALWLYFRFFKLFKVKNIVFVDGALGTGKTFLSVALAVRLWKKRVRVYKLKKWFFNAFRNFNRSYFDPKLKKLELPRLYSNIRLRNVPFVKLTRELLFRQSRFAYGSVVLIDEFSLMADQFCYKDREMSERLSLFFKLFRHETLGGYCVINSQSTSDLHYSLKYVLSDYLYIHHCNRHWPFVTSLKVQELIYCGDQSGSNVVNVRSKDIEETCKTLLVLKKYYKYYDSYCYSIFTDACPVYRVEQTLGKGDSLKDVDLVSFKNFMFLYENVKRDKKKEVARKGDC